MTKKKGFTFIELMVVVILLAGLIIFAVPNYRHVRVMQKSLRSGVNLKQANSAVDQWTMERGGVPSTEAYPVPVQQASGGTYKIGDNWIKEVIAPYSEDPFGIMETPNQVDEKRYDYMICKSAQTGRLKGVVMSSLNGNGRYEAKMEGSESFDGRDVDKVFVNGYEDAEFWLNGMPCLVTETETATLP